MNQKNALFLSASLTAFVLAVLFAVVTKVTNTPTVAQAAAPATLAATATDVPPTDEPTAEVVVPSPTVPGPLGPEEAANIAAKALNRTDVYSVETFNYNGTDGYKVVFIAGDNVFVTLDRTVVTMATPAPVVVNVPAIDPTNPPKKHKGGGGGGGSSTPPTQQPPNPTEPPGDDHDN